MSTTILKLLIIYLNTFATLALIVPDELPSILSVIYSNIPTIKKGTDSRVGWGFRLGDRADFQVLVELGPQQYTQKLANQNEDDNKNKRHVGNTLSDTLYASRDSYNQPLRGATPVKVAGEEEEDKTNQKLSEAEKWLKNWAKNSRNKQENETFEVKNEGVRPGIAIGEIDAKSVFPDDSALKKQEEIDRLLKQLRKMQKEQKDIL